MVDLSDNTNRWGAPPEASRVLRDGVELARYPTRNAAAIKREVASYLGVAPEWIAAGCGSGDVLDAAVRAYAEPGDCIALPDPTFGLMAEIARANRLDAACIALTSQLDVDDERMLETRARVTYLCSPNNPTGAPFSPARVKRIVGEAAGLVIVDEAYAEFGDWSAVGLAMQHDNVLVVRTLSKAFGLAGLRVGYCVGAPEVVSRVEAARPPYPVSLVAERTVTAALTADLGWVRDRADEVRRNREAFASALMGLGLRALPSAANFVLVPCGPRAEQLRGHGIAVREFLALRGIGDAVRITIGPWPEMEACLEAIARCA